VVKTSGGGYEEIAGLVEELRGGLIEFRVGFAAVVGALAAEAAE
jgi:hypothetical protein